MGIGFFRKKERKESLEFMAENLDLKLDDPQKKVRRYYWGLHLKVKNQN